jgi:hypothetical protein
MTRRQRWSLTLLAFAALGVFYFVATANIVRLPGNYKLHRHEGSLCYLHRDGQNQVGGVFQGPVFALGWNDDTILAFVDKSLANEPDGWYTIDVKTRKISGVLSDQQVRSDPVLSRIPCRKALSYFD